MMKTDELKIFLVDNDTINQKNYLGHLAQLGYNNAHTFNSGRQCVNRLFEQPDVIFLASGGSAQIVLETLRQIRAFNPDIQVILLPGTEYLTTLNTSNKAQNKAAGVQHNGYLIGYIDTILSRLLPQTQHAA